MSRSVRILSVAVLVVDKQSCILIIDLRNTRQYLKAKCMKRLILNIKVAWQGKPWIWQVIS